MSLLKDFEDRIESTLEGFFARRFKSGVHPVEVAKRLAREMDSGRTIGVAKVYAPTDYAVLLSKKDYDRIQPYEDAFTRELADFLVAHAAKEHYALLQRPTIKLSAKAGLTLGRMEVESVLAAEPDRPSGGGTEVISAEMVEELKRQIAAGAEPEAPARPARLEMEDGDQVFALAGEHASIGRLAASDVKLADSNVSRRHAEIVRTPDGYEIIDLGSTNGTLVNDEPVRSRLLADGDRVTLGTVTLIFRDGSGV